MTNNLSKIQNKSEPIINKSLIDSSGLFTKVYVFIASLQLNKTEVYSFTK